MGAANFGLVPVSTPAAKSLDDWRALVRKALARADISEKVAAAEMGISPTLLSHQLTGREHAHLSFWRMQALPPEFWRELILLILDFHSITVGATQRDQEDAAVGRLIREAYCGAADGKAWRDETSKAPGHHPGFDWGGGVEGVFPVTYLTTFTHEQDPAKRTEKLRDWRERVKKSFERRDQQLRKEGDSPNATQE